MSSHSLISSELCSQLSGRAWLSLALMGRDDSPSVGCKLSSGPGNNNCEGFVNKSL